MGFLIATYGIIVGAVVGYAITLRARRVRLEGQLAEGPGVGRPQGASQIAVDNPGPREV
jgi:hypothetical protein